MCIVYKKYRGLSRKRSELENVSWKTDKRWGLWRLFYREEKEGIRFSSGVSEEDVRNWVSGLGLEQ